MARVLAFLALAAVLVACVPAGVAAQEYKDWGIYDYVHSDAADSFNWTLTTKIEMLDFTVYNIFLTSQTWPANCSTTTWTHWLMVCVPDFHIGTDIGFMYMDGGHTPTITNPPTKSGIDPFSTAVCGTSGTVSAHLSAIPDESMYCYPDQYHKDRSEDALIAWTWRRYLNVSSDPRVLLRYPMTLAGVSAMTAIQQFVARDFPEITPIEHFVVAGASKRGWTTWTVGGVDPRVVGIIPMVAPVGNLVPQIAAMWQWYGNWSFALDDYLDEHLMDWLENPIFHTILDKVGPLAFKENLTMPIMAIVDTGDEFFLPNGIDYMWDELTSENKFFRTVANAEHSLSGHQVDFFLSDVSAFYMAIINDRPHPHIGWNVSADGNTITAWVENLAGQEPIQPHKVIMWHAVNSQRRDFRWIVCGDIDNPDCINPIFWVPKEVEETNGVWVAHYPDPGQGWAGFMLEFEYNNQGGTSFLDPLKITTQLSIVPQTLPYPPCGSICNHTYPTAGGDDDAW